MKTSSQSILRQLIMVWADFESKLQQVPIIHKLLNQQLRKEHYLQMLVDHRQQVIEGSRWIAQAAASIDSKFAEHRSIFIKHAATEHLDYKMLEDNYVALGGELATIQHSEKNIGSEALSAWIFQQASKPNPFDLIGAMFIIEGLGEKFARIFATHIKQQLDVSDKAISFYSYHSEHDEDHLQQIEELLSAERILQIPNIEKRIIKTAKVTARLYLLQLEEIGHY